MKARAARSISVRNRAASASSLRGRQQRAGGAAAPATGIRRRAASRRARRCRPRASCDDVHRHRVEHFVGDHQRVERRRQRVEPFDATRRAAASRVQQFAAGAALQIGAGFEDQVALRQAVQRCELREQVAASAPLPAPSSRMSAMPARRICATWRASVRPNNAPELGRGDEIAGGAELGARRRCSSRGPARAARAPCSARSSSSRRAAAISRAINSRSRALCATASAAGAGRW